MMPPCRMLTKDTWELRMDGIRVQENEAHLVSKEMAMDHAISRIPILSRSAILAVSIDCFGFHVVLKWPRAN